MCGIASLCVGVFFFTYLCVWVCVYLWKICDCNCIFVCVSESCLLVDIACMQDYRQSVCKFSSIY